MAPCPYRGCGAEPMVASCVHPERSEEHTSELQSQSNLVCRLLLEKKNTPAHRPTFFRHPANKQIVPDFSNESDTLRAAARLLLSLRSFAPRAARDYLTHSPHSVSW